MSRPNGGPLDVRGKVALLLPLSLRMTAWPNGFRMFSCLGWGTMNTSTLVRAGVPELALATQAKVETNVRVACQRRSTSA